MFARILTGLSLAAFTGLVAFLCAFKVDDVDVWWHLKAGELMVRTGAWIDTDPFAYTREGQPYRATYAWLAQIVMYLVHAAGGATALIVFRTALVGLTFWLIAAVSVRGALPPRLARPTPSLGASTPRSERAGSLTWLARDNRSALWIALPVALLGAARVLPSLSDRPHLFTYALLATFVLVATRILDAPPYGRRLAILLVVLEVLWVNLHAGAALVGVAVWIALLLQVAWDARFSAMPAGGRRAGLRMPLVVLGGLMLAQVAFPTGASLAYLYSTLTDQTRSFILEWQPRPWGPYLQDLGPWWVAALLAVALVRHKPVFCLALLVGFGGLSRTAYRHEALFVIAATGVLMYQWRGSGAFARASAWLFGRPWRAAVVLAVVFLLAGVAVHRAWARYGRFFQTYGYGSLEMAGGAAAFLDREGIGGPMFNSYDLGADLIYRGRKVFVDTRNVDYGYAFLKRTFDAANDREVWNGLDREYAFTHAVLWYAPYVPSPPLPYIRHLEGDAAWALVYLDDRTAVYLKRTAGNAAVIGRHEYRLLTPLGLQSGEIVARTPRARFADLEQELIRAAAADADSIQARLLLAQIYIQVYRHDEALTLLRAAMATAPRAYRPHALLGSLYARQEKWTDAGREFETAIALAGDSAARFDYAYLAEIFDKAGDPARAAAYRRRSSSTPN